MITNKSTTFLNPPYSTLDPRQKPTLLVLEMRGEAKGEMS